VVGPIPAEVSLFRRAGNENAPRFLKGVCIWLVVGYLTWGVRRRRPAGVSSRCYLGVNGAGNSRQAMPKTDEEKQIRFQRQQKGKRGLPLQSRRSAIPSDTIPASAPITCSPVLSSICRGFFCSLLALVYTSSGASFVLVELSK
jgi:hypothetical protein